jgi:hypothetical protein
LVPFEAIPPIEEDVVEPISFVTIFLPLMVGVHPVELVVGDDVASVEIVLDGNQIAEEHDPFRGVAALRTNRDADTRRRPE